ncbi:MAG: hypothetical protein Q4D38_00610 [Planctomycetia bacterium]|nr:hypothetical protein [Planctomycetia bacterium]
MWRKIALCCFVFLAGLLPCRWGSAQSFLEKSPHLSKPHDAGGNQNFGSECDFGRLEASRDLVRAVLFHRAETFRKRESKLGERRNKVDNQNSDWAISNGLAQLGISPADALAKRLRVSPRCVVQERETKRSDGFLLNALRSLSRDGSAVDVERAVRFVENTSCTFSIAKSWVRTALGEGFSSAQLRQTLAAWRLDSMRIVLFWRAPDSLPHAPPPGGCLCAYPVAGVVSLTQKNTDAHRAPLSTDKMPHRSNTSLAVDQNRNYLAEYSSVIRTNILII